MRFLNHALLSVLLSLSSILLLPSCATMPPDALGCTAYPASQWPEMKDTFIKLCSDDAVCSVNLQSWKDRLATWTYPSDAGTCVTWVTSKAYDLDATHPLPGELSANGKPKTWTDLMAEGVFLPAEESYSKMKTFTQSFCHNAKQCGPAANWQGTVGSIDNGLKLQSTKLQSLDAKYGKKK